MPEIDGAVVGAAACGEEAALPGAKGHGFDGGGVGEGVEDGGRAGEVFGCVVVGLLAIMVGVTGSICRYNRW